MVPVVYRLSSVFCLNGEARVKDESQSESAERGGLVCLTAAGESITSLASRSRPQGAARFCLNLNSELVRHGAFAPEPLREIWRAMAGRRIFARLARVSCALRDASRIGEE